MNQDTLVSLIVNHFRVVDVEMIPDFLDSRDDKFVVRIHGKGVGELLRHEDERLRHVWLSVNAPPPPSISRSYMER